MSVTEGEQQAREIKLSWIAWSVGAGLALGAAVWAALMLTVRPASVTDTFNVAKWFALLPPAVLTAVISVRRINLSERQHRHQIEVDLASRQDAIQRRITELSAKASDQLGSESRRSGSAA
jgi:cytochrome bd-type quinol oxidase subunit 2